MDKMAQEKLLLRSYLRSCARAARVRYETICNWKSRENPRRGRDVSDCQHEGKVKNQDASEVEDKA